MKKYWVTGIWKDPNNKITHLYIHNEASKEKPRVVGAKVTEKQLIKMILDGAEVCIRRWNYQTASWVSGLQVHALKDVKTGDYYLSLPFSDRVYDNLHHMIDMSSII